MKKLVGLLVVFLAFISAPSARADAPPDYSATGPFSTSAFDVPGFRVFDPEGGGPHPVVTFGNGTSANYHDYEGLLEHLASWGIVTIVADSARTGDGVAITDAARYLLDENAVPGSRFEGRIDTGSITSMGHSQGAGGAVQAANHSDGLITSTVTLNLPDPWWVSEPSHRFDIRAIANPILMLTGGDDFLTTQHQAYFDAVPGEALQGRHIGTGHLWPRDGGDIRGYVTAWILSDHTSVADKLLGDPHFTARWHG